jgi:phage repressor protein C with HTH and peptisase S24 domain
VICDVLGITLQQLFGLDAPGDALSEREINLVAQYRQLNKGDQYTVDTMVRTMVTVDQARKRQKSRRKVYELPLVDRTLAAGIGDPTEYEGSSSPFYLYDVPWLNRADCVFKVNGDSMEPEYHNGDFVLIERIPDAPELKHGEIGAFAIGNELYIKEYQADGLHSLNAKYPVMTFDDDTKVYLIGRVLCVVDQKDIATDEDVRLYETVKE